MRTKLSKPVILDVVEEAFNIELSRTRHAKVRCVMCVGVCSVCAVSAWVVVGGGV
jgi:hypothetical protein